MKRFILIIYLLILMTLVGWAQSLKVNVPSHVQNGENFRLSYTLNTQNATDFRIGNIPEGLELITGPYTSSQSSFQMVNGHTSSSSSTTYTFILCANKNGTFTIPPARVNVNGKTITSSSIKVTVSGTVSSQGSAPQMHQDTDNHQMRQTGTKITGRDLFIKVSANKQRVHEQEPILLTYKLYTLVDLISLEGKMPDLTGFHSQEIARPQQPSYHIETVNGRKYRSVVWSQYVMYPQMTGKLEIPPITFTGVVVQENRDIDPFEAFLNGGSGYTEVRRTIKAPGITVQVDPLPKRPADFSGGVGHFNISARLNKTEVKANDPITIRVVVSGTGNLKLIKQPTLKLPTDFDKYDAKVTDKTRLTANGVEGNMIYDFLCVPRNKGVYTVDPITFNYYDTQINAYKTIKTQSLNINVKKGDGSSYNSADFTNEKNKDIRPIKKGIKEIKKSKELFYGSVLYWALLLGIFLIFVVLMIIFRKRVIENADIVKRRGKNANKVAKKRLKKAAKLMKENKQGEFYDEVLRALWGYVGDRLNIPVTDLSHDNIEEKLHLRDVNETTIVQFMKALDECEYEQYAPGDAKGNMYKTYNTAMNAIMEIEKSTKGQKNYKSRTVVLFIIVLSFSLFNYLSVMAVTKDNADTAYSNGNYLQAIKDYENLLKKGESADLYYNLGNAYYRTENIPRAVINYERALLLSPSDGDIRFNLQMARSKTIDKIMPPSEMFFVSWYYSLVNILNVDEWAVIAIFSILLTLILALIYLFSPSILLRKIGFIGGLLSFMLFIFSNIFAIQQRNVLMKRTGAIIVTPSALIMSTPSANSINEGIIHEGTRVDIVDDSMKDWKEIRLGDGREGWITTRSIEKI